MDLIRLSDIAPASGDTVVCLGTFDGVHIGHQALARRTADIAAQKGLIPCACTFDRPPTALLTPEDAPGMLTDIREKAALLAKFGIARVVYSPFDVAMAAMPAQWFFEDVLRGRLHAQHVVIGFHYRFGRCAQGDAALMRALCHQSGIALDVLPPVCTEYGEVVSSTAIRQCLRQGDRISAEKMLDRPLSHRETQLLGGNVHV